MNIHSLVCVCGHSGTGSILNGTMSWCRSCGQWTAVRQVKKRKPYYPPAFKIDWGRKRERASWATPVLRRTNKLENLGCEYICRYPQEAEAFNYEIGEWRDWNPVPVKPIEKQCKLNFEVEVKH